MKKDDFYKYLTILGFVIAIISLVTSEINHITSSNMKDTIIKIMSSKK